MAGLAAIAERPDRVVKLFRRKEKGNEGYFSVRLLYKGKWKTINMDDYLPVKNSSVLFGKSTSQK